VLKKRRESGAFFNFKSFLNAGNLNAKSAKVSQRKKKEERKKKKEKRHLDYVQSFAKLCEILAPFALKPPNKNHLQNSKLDIQNSDFKINLSYQFQ